MSDFRMPSLGADMVAATLVRWRVKPGDVVKRGDIVADVETEKGVIEAEIFQAGTVAELIVAPGTKVPVGTVLARLNGAEGAKPAAPVVAPAPAPAPSVPVAPPPTRVAPPLVLAPPTPPSPPLPAVAPADHVRASPAARRHAAEHAVELARVTGTGPGGVVTLSDVERLVQSAAPPVAAAPVAPAPAQPVAPPTPEAPRSGAERARAMRRAIAAAMSRANREIPHYYLTTDIDLSRALAWLRGENERHAVTERILPAALLLKATALAAREVPEVNGHWVDDAFRPGDAVHLGVVVSLHGGGLLAPAIHDAAALPLGDFMRALRDVVNRARGGGLRSSELSDATLTVTNLGDLGVGSVLGVIYPPQVALVGFGRVFDRPWAVDGMLAVRPIVTATLAADHRASDAHRGGIFLSTIARLLQAPESL